MLIYHLISALCLLALSGGCIGILIHYIRLDHAGRVQFLRSFKKGNCALVYFPALPLYFMGHLYQKDDLLTSFFSTVNETLELVVLKFNTQPLEALMAASGLYRFTIYFCFFLVCVNTVVFTLSLLGQYLWNQLQRLLFRYSKKEKLILLGNDPETRTIYKSDSARSKLILDVFSGDDQASLYEERIACLPLSGDERGIQWICSSIEQSKQPVTLIVHTQDDERNISLCSRLLEKLALKDRDVDFFLRLHIFVIGDPRYEAIYENLMDRSQGCLRYVNKYQQIAINFIDRYPLTRFMAADQLDTATSLVPPDVNINVLLIGFGKANREIFLTSLANNQFITRENGEITLKPVHYHIFDKEKSDDNRQLKHSYYRNKNLNHNYYRFTNECAGLENDPDHLPMPPAPATESYHTLDVNDHSFYQNIRSILTRSPADCNYIVIAFGSDLENIDMAQKLSQKRQEWGTGKLPIFVRVRSLYQTQTLPRQEDCYFIGCENEEILHIDKILQNQFARMAQRRDLLHALESSPCDSETVKKLERDIQRDWFLKNSRLERDSSLYCCLSLRSKLHMMGLDYCDAAGSARGLTEEEYLRRYAGGDLPQYESRRCSNGMPIVRHSLPFKRSRRGDLAAQEHYRWNAYMLSRGFIPASICQIRTELRADGKPTNGKRYDLRRHGNLTTMQGLEQFRQLRVQRDGCSEISADVIKYDYQLLDEAWWLLKDIGCKIIEKN